MRCFLKYFSIILAVQLLAAGLAFGVPKVFGEIWGLFAYVFYAAPMVLIAGNNSGEKHEVSSFFLFGIPMIVWSSILSLAICGFGRLKKRQ